MATDGGPSSSYHVQSPGKLFLSELPEQSSLIATCLSLQLTKLAGNLEALAAKKIFFNYFNNLAQYNSFFYLSLCWVSFISILSRKKKKGLANLN
jgi:hypothetical protein